MVGLTAFGEAAWSCEQLYNARLAEAVVRADEPLCDFTGRALDQLEDWIGRVAEGQDDAPQGASLIAEAQALRLGVQAAPAEAAPAAGCRGRFARLARFARSHRDARGVGGAGAARGHARA
jgi:chemosensory pili system protein ChpA (sensor histidine kinase/response regulator)